MTTKTTTAKYARQYDNEKSAKLAAQKLNKEKGKNVYIVIEDGEEFLVVHINSLI